MPRSKWAAKINGEDTLVLLTIQDILRATGVKMPDGQPSGSAPLFAALDYMQKVYDTSEYWAALPPHLRCGSRVFARAALRHELGGVLAKNRR